MYQIIKIGLGILIGCALGFTYYKVIGCNTGACPITSNSFASSIYGGIVGFLFALAV